MNLIESEEFARQVKVISTDNLRTLQQFLINELIITTKELTDRFYKENELQITKDEKTRNQYINKIDFCNTLVSNIYKW